MGALTDSSLCSHRCPGTHLSVAIFSTITHLVSTPNLLTHRCVHATAFALLPFLALFGLEWQILSKVRTSADEDPVEPPSCDAEDENNGDDRPEEDENGSDSASSEFSLIAALASTQLIDSAWRSAPSYSPSYLSTSTEYLPPQYVPKLPKGLKIENLVEGDKTEDGITWVREKYEDSLYLDQVFERFAQRVAIEGKQCLRFVI